MPSPAVSIILTTYNRADLITRAVVSVQTQTMPDWELIIVDDGSTDDTAGRLEPYLTDKRIRYAIEPHRGVVPTINHGIGLSSVPVVTFLCSDDYYKPEHLAANLTYLVSHPEIDIVHSNAEVLGERSVPDITRSGELIDVDECYLEGTLFVRRRVLERITFDTQAALGEAYRLVQNALATGFTIHKLASRTYVYDRTRPNSLTKRAQINATGARRPG